MKQIGFFIAMLMATASLAAEREYIYGAELMNAREREQYRQGFGKAKTDEAKGAFRHRHKERLRERARNRGIELDENTGIARKAQEK